MTSLVGSILLLITIVNLHWFLLKKRTSQAEILPTQTKWSLSRYDKYSNVEYL